ncbi:MAG: hypothetical protein R3275_09735 [Saprospiraceae bacterium]|nr:hypothetical protein [Saprospiraceae bacterium]
MNLRSGITLLTLLVALLSVWATIHGISAVTDKSFYDHLSIREQSVKVYGTGLYRHMPAEVAVQGIAQDYVTLFLAVPLLLIGLYFFRMENVRGKILLTGLLLYFTVTYMIYLTMGMYNEIFLVYVGILACALIALISSLAAFNYRLLKGAFERVRSLRPAAYFLLVNCLLIALLWLDVVVPPLFDGSIYPEELYHFTTLIVQGLDLAIFLPLGVVSAILALWRHSEGFVFTSVYIVFLAILMIALTTKVLFMAAQGQQVVPVIFVMPTIAAIAIFFSLNILFQLKLGSTD